MKGCENIFWMSFIRRQCKGAATLRRAINIWQTLFANVCRSEAKTAGIRLGIMSASADPNPAPSLASET